MNRLTNLICKLLFVLVIASISLTGCTLRVRTSLYEAGVFRVPGFFEQNRDYVAVKSNRKVFDKSGVKMRFMAGLYESRDKDPESDYSRRSFFVLYASESADDEEEMISFLNEFRKRNINDGNYGKSHTLKDYKNVNSHFLIREFSGEEAFSGIFAYETHYLPLFHSGVSYKDSIEITVPESVFSKEEGKFYLLLQGFGYNLNIPERYVCGYSGHVTLGYKMIDSETVEINFNVEQLES